MRKALALIISTDLAAASKTSILTQESDHYSQTLEYETYRDGMVLRLVLEKRDGSFPSMSNPFIKQVVALTTAGALPVEGLDFPENVKGGEFYEIIELQYLNRALLGTNVECKNGDAFARNELAPWRGSLGAYKETATTVTTEF